MIKEYEINSETLVVIPMSKKTSKVIEEHTTLIVNKSTTEIIDDSCKYFGSSYLGRFEGTKRIIGVNYKSPILVEETREIIFFPTSSPRFDNCYWLALKKINDYKKTNMGAKVFFKNGYELDLPMSYLSLENQILRSTLLESKIRKRKLIKND